MASQDKLDILKKREAVLNAPSMSREQLKKVIILEPQENIPKRKKGKQ